MQAQKAALAAANGEDDEGRISLSKANMDSDIYGDKRLADYHSSIPANEDADYDVSTYYCFKSFLSILIILFFLQDDDTENTNGAMVGDSYNTYKTSINAFNAPKNYLQDVIDDVSDCNIWPQCHYFNFIIIFCY